MSEYEKIRENIIAQRKKECALKEAEWDAEWEKELKSPKLTIAIWAQFPSCFIMKSTIF